MADRPAVFQAIPRAGVEQFGPGEPLQNFRTADFILTHGDGWEDKFIRFGQGLRIHGDDAKYTYWNHAAIIVGDDGALVEALGEGVVKTDVSKYTTRDAHLVRLDASDEDRAEAAKYALYCADVHESYDYATIVSIAISLLTGAKLTFQIDGQKICSGLVAGAMERTNAIFDREPGHMMPADLAKYYTVSPPS